MKTFVDSLEINAFRMTYNLKFSLIHPNIYFEQIKYVRSSTNIIHITIMKQICTMTNETKIFQIVNILKIQCFTILLYSFYNCSLSNNLFPSDK